MRSRRLACLLLGLWLGAGLLMAWVEAENRRSVDRLLAQPTPGLLLQFKVVQRQPATQLLRYLAAEQDRFWLETWETIQLFLGALFFFFLLFATKQGKFSLALALLMLLIVAAQRFGLTPEIVSRGRVADFAASLSRRDRVQSQVLEYAYLMTDLAKYTLGLILGGLLIWPHGRSVDAGQEIYQVDKANHRHINR